MRTVLELMMELTQADCIAHGAKISAESGITGAKEVYMAWGKEGGESVKDLEAAWKEAQPEKVKGGARGFADIYYDWLAEAARSEQEAHDFIMCYESNNVRNHLTHYLNIWALAETVRKGEKVSRTISAGKATPRPKGSKASAKEDAWEYNSASPYEDVRSAWETLNREVKAKRPRKTAVHPDKVAKFDDEELTNAYTKAFQTYSKVR